jgi:toxin-antitoxin system PIN domain toxin
MTLFYPDLNIWLALSVEHHQHYQEVWKWLNRLPKEIKLIFSRYTHLGLLRLLTNRSAMGERATSLRTAWNIYEGWLVDPRVEFRTEPEGVDLLLRELTEPFADRTASKVIGDCYLLACARASQATLVTFDRALYDLARQKGYAAVMPGADA